MNERLRRRVIALLAEMQPRQKATSRALKTLVPTAAGRRVLAEALVNRRPINILR